jgi:hypothetical protein
MPRLLGFVRNDFSIDDRPVNVILHGAKAMLNIGETAGLARSAGACGPTYPTACR